MTAVTVMTNASGINEVNGDTGLSVEKKKKEQNKKLLCFVLLGQLLFFLSSVETQWNCTPWLRIFTFLLIKIKYMCEICAPRIQLNRTIINNCANFFLVMLLDVNIEQQNKQKQNSMSVFVCVVIWDYV